MKPGEYERIVRNNDIKKSMLKKMQKLARSKGGSCLSKEYINANIELRWKCEKGHVWKANLYRIKKGQWCPMCKYAKVRKIKKLALRKMQDIANARGGKCLSKSYVNTYVKMRWRCAEGHEWEALPYYIKLGRWCPVCARIKRGEARRLTIEEMQIIAKKRSGECLSNKYVNAFTKLKWRCKEGHIWEATPNSIKNGSWCPVCGHAKAGKARRSYLKKMRGIERERAGNSSSE